MPRRSTSSSQASSELESGNSDRALALAQESLMMIDSTGHRMDEALNHLVLGEIFARIGDAAAATAAFSKAQDVARSQQAKGWELRAAMGQANLWKSQGRSRDAYALLAPIYDWFTEGLDSKDLIEAKALLVTLGH